MSYEKFKKTIYFFNDFDNMIDITIVKKMSNVLYVEFVEYKDFYDPHIKVYIYSYKAKANANANKFNKSVDLFPSHIKSIIFNNMFNQKVDNLPSKLKKLVFGKYFNQKVDNLPSELKELVFGKYFNQAVDNLPTKIIKLIFGLNFNQPILNLPSIKILALSWDFNNTLDYLPSSITHLEINLDLLAANFNLSSSIKYIIVEDTPRKNIKCNIPKNTIILFNNAKNNYLKYKKIKY